MISTRGRYSIRILLDLAEHGNGEFIPMKEVAARQGISLKYIERMMPVLKTGGLVDIPADPLFRSGLVDSLHGIGGGYRLTKEPSEVTLWDILILAEGDLAPVSCLQENAAVCERAAACRTLPVWEDYYKLTKDYFRGITLENLMRQQR